MPVPFLSLLVLAVALAAGSDAAAMGFGNVRSATYLGQPLSLAVPVRLDDDESLAPECVRAEVTAGEEAIAPEAVRIRITGGREPGERLIRVTTTSAILEPVVSVRLSAGCPPRISRSFTTFADPPEFRTAQAAPSSPATTAPAAPAQAAPAARATADEGSPAEGTPSARAPEVQPAPAAEGRPPAPRAQSAPAPRAQAPRASRPRAARPGAEAGRPVATAPSPAAAPARAPAPAPAQPRLKLDPLEPLPNTADAQRAAAAEAQASAARQQALAAQEAASAADGRLRQLESEIAQLRAEAKANRDALAQVRGRVPQAATDGRYLPWLIGLLGVLILIAIALGWRLLSLSRAPVRSGGGSPTERWYGPSEVPESVHGEVPKSPPPPEPASPTLPAAAVSAPVPLAPSRAAVTAVAAAAAARPREVTVEEQIDLEQQADFFIALGQDDAAIDLLLTHLRGTGGTSPMPYLKLLDIYRRRNERDVYERTAARFNQRFNGVAPAWDADPSAGRSLEDYPALLARIQRLWWTPLDAMAELEALLFRKGEGSELFDLPAYLDVLFLYQIARELHQAEQPSGTAAAPQVDVLLPIGDPAGGDALSVRHVDMSRTSTLRGPAPERIEPISLDLDLSTDAAALPALPESSDITLGHLDKPPRTPGSDPG